MIRQPISRIARLFIACAALSACEVSVDATPEPGGGESAGESAPAELESELLPGDLADFCDFGPDITAVRADVSIDLSRTLSSDRNGAPDGSERAEGRAIVSACLLRKVDERGTPDDPTDDDVRYFVLAQQNITAEAALFVEEPDKANFGFYNVGLGIFIRPQAPDLARLRSDISAPRTENEAIETSEKRTLSIGGGVKAGCEAGVGSDGGASAKCSREASLNVSWSRERYRKTVEQAWEVVRSPDAELSAEEAGWHWYQNEFYDGSLPGETREGVCADNAFQRGEFLLEQLPKMGRQLDVNALAIWEVARPDDDVLRFDVEVFHDLDLAYKKNAKKLCQAERTRGTGHLMLHFAPFDGEAIPEIEETEPVFCPPLSTACR